MNEATVRSRSRSEQKRLSIIDAAAALFTEEGYENTSMDSVASKAGVSKQTVYSHFGSKEDLFTFCIQGKCAATVLNTEVLNSEGCLREELVNLGRRFLSLIMSEEGVKVMRVCISSADRYPELGRRFFSAGPQNMSEKITAYLDAKVVSGELAIENTSFAAWQLLSMLKGEASLRSNLGLRDEASEASLVPYIESCVDLFLRGYQP